MKSFMYAARAIFVTLLLGCSGLAYADGACPPGGTGTAECPQDNVDTVDVRGGREREDNEGHCRVDCGGGGERDNGGGSGSATASSPSTAFKTDKRLCIRANESCDNWLFRADPECAFIYNYGGPGTVVFNTLSCQGAVATENRAGCATVRGQNSC